MLHLKFPLMALHIWQSRSGKKLVIQCPSIWWVVDKDYALLVPEECGHDDLGAFIPRTSRLELPGASPPWFLFAFRCIIILVQVLSLVTNLNRISARFWLYLATSALLMVACVFFISAVSILVTHTA